MKRIIILILSFALLLTGCSASVNNENNAVNNSEDYVKSVWITYFELESYTSENDTQKDFEKEISSVFKKVKSIGLNTITVQVRPCADAFYKSEYFPASKYCFGVQGSELKYDPLEIMVDCAHNIGLRIEAWINPYRVSQNNDINELSDNNYAKKWLNNEETKSNVYIDDKIYFNPASSVVTELIVNGVKEIVSNYDVDAIHFDDYFYPTVKEEIDEKEYSEYIASGGGLSLDDWRRDNVSNMVSSVYCAIKEINPNVLFGISPQSRVSTNYNNLYADVEKWSAEEGYVDYICPQIYFGFYNEVQPFTRTVKEWCSRATSARLYVGLPLYKAGREDEFASNDQDYAINEFKDNNNIISRQVVYLNQLNAVKGYYIYSLSYLLDDENEAVKKEVEGIKNLN